jgi:uncharacterized membrane protein YdbT with pleckstrin-like domain
MDQQPTQPPKDFSPEPQPVYLSRAVSPMGPEVSPEVKAKHDESVKKYPELNLSEAEFILSAVQRHPIGYLIPVAVSGFLIAVIAALVISYPMITASDGPMDNGQYANIVLIGTMLSLLFAIGGYIAVWIFKNNRFFLTNESAIQEIQLSLFARREQTVSLANVEDASYRQQGIIQMLFNYGTIRLSTQGDETTYRFTYVIDPKTQIALLNNAVEAFKNGRPIE